MTGQAWTGGPIGDRALCVLAGNPGPMTLDGTNTWILLEPGSREAAVIDPGPEDAAHRSALIAALQEAGVRATVTLLTHGHADHAEGARSFAEATGCAVRALDPHHRHGGEGLAEGDRVAVGDLDLRVVHTPGHTHDSLCFWMPADGSILTGDTVLGRGTSVIAWPDGDLAHYLQSLDRLQDLAVAESLRAILPGHGPVLTDATATIEGYIRHRRARLEQVRDALASGAATAEEVVDRVYADVPADVRFAALMSVKAQLAYLRS